MGKFSLSGSTPKKVLYNGVEVKKILFNNVEVWRKAIEAGSKSVTMYAKEETKTLSFTVPDGVKRLRLTTTFGYSNNFTVTPGESVNFTFHSSPFFMSYYYIKYSFNGSDFRVMGTDHASLYKDSVTITISWSEEINNS